MWGSRIITYRTQLPTQDVLDSHPLRFMPPSHIIYSGPIRPGIALLQLPTFEALARQRAIAALLDRVEGNVERGRAQTDMLKSLKVSAL